jgi:ribosome recycling factor
VIRINIPPLTEERRSQLVKQVKSEGETSKIGVRHAREWAKKELKRMQKEGLSEDAEKSAEDDLQELTDEYIKKVDEIVEKKEEDIMTI